MGGIGTFDFIFSYTDMVISFCCYGEYWFSIEMKVYGVKCKMVLLKYFAHNHPHHYYLLHLQISRIFHCIFPSEETNINSDGDHPQND